MYRIATYLNTIPSAIEMIEYCHNKGYETTVNIMAISNANTADLDIALDILGRSCVDGIYIVDSYGSLYPEQTAAISRGILKLAISMASKLVCTHIITNSLHLQIQ